jgi:hypothetical protein
MTGWRRYALPVLLWVYGISVTVTLISLWGRAIVVDTGLLASAAEDAAGAPLISRQIEVWLAGQIADVPVLDATVADDLAADLVSDPALQATLDALVGAVVTAAAAPEGEAEVDVAALLSPAVPALTEGLAASGIPVPEAAVAEYVATLDPLVVREEGSEPVVGSRSGTARSLSIATVVGMLVMLASGTVAVRMSEDRRTMLRSLLHRLAIGALGYAVIFQLGAWILDPGGGQAPVRSAAARLIGAKLWVPLVVAAGAAGAGWLLRRRRSNGGKRSGGQPHHPGESEDDTRGDQQAIHQRPIQG